MNIIITLKQEPKGYFALKSDSTNTAIVNAIAKDSTHIGYANARALMKLVFNKQYLAPFFPITHTDNFVKPHRKIITGLNNSQLSNMNSQIKVYPNPAKNEISVAYNITANVQEANFTLYDEFGNIVASWDLPLNQNQITENISSLSAGFYLYCILVDGKAMQRGKLVIEK